LTLETSVPPRHLLRLPAPRPDRPLTAALAALMVAVALMVGLSVGLAPTARVALVTFASVDRASDMTVDETDPSAALLRSSLSTKLTRQASALDGPPRGTVPFALALVPTAGTTGPIDRVGPIVTADRAGPPATSGHLTGRIPTGPPALVSPAV